MAYVFDEPRIGMLAIAGIDTGVTTANGTVIPTPPAVLGSVVRAFDPAFGEGEFILLKGAASTVVGSCVIWDATNTGILATTTANQARPVAFAMSANASASTFGWYQVYGQVQALKDTSASVTPGVAVGIVSTGAIGNTSAGLEIEGARAVNTATVLAATTVLPIYCDRPALQGRIT